LSVIGALFTANVISAYPSLAIQVDADSIVPVAGSVETAPKPDVPMAVAAPLMMKSDVMLSGVQQPGSVPISDVKTMVGSLPAGVMNSMAVAAPPMPVGDVKNMAAMVGSLPEGVMHVDPMPPMPLGDVKTMMVAMPLGDVKPMPDMVGSVPSGVVNTMTATGGVMPVGDMKAMDVMPMVKPMPESPMPDRPMPMIDPPMPKDGSMLRGAPMVAVAYEAPVAMMSEDKNEMAVMSMAGPKKAPGGMSIEPSEDAADDGKAEKMPVMMAASSGGEKPMVANRAEVMRSPDGAKAEVMRGQAGSVNAMSPKVALGVEDGDQAVVASDAEKKPTGTKKSGVKQAGDRKLFGAQKKNSGARANNVKRNGGKGQNGAKKGQSAANKAHNGANKKQNGTNKRSQIAAKKAKNSASANLKDFAGPKRKVIEPSQ
jgi:hypothetical protein